MMLAATCEVGDNRDIFIHDEVIEVYFKQGWAGGGAGVA